MNPQNLWAVFWLQAGRVPLRSKIIGIVVAPMLILGGTMAWWVRNELGGWLSYLLSEERVAQAMSVGMRGVFIITLIAAVSGLGIAWLLTWLLTRPLLQITQVATYVKDGGDLSLRAPVWANDEIGNLGRAFNAMIDSLQHSRVELEQSNRQLTERNNELAVLYELARVANHHTKELALGRSLSQSMEVIDADAGLLLTFVPPHAIHIDTSCNLSSTFLEDDLRQPPVMRFFWQVVETKRMLHIANIADSPNAPAELIAASKRDGFTTYLIFPLLVKNVVQGALVMLFYAPTELSTRDQQLFLAICDQLSMALENSHLWEELRQKERIRTQLLNKVVSAQEEERRRISRELHDETGQALTSLLVQLKILERQQTVEAMTTRVEDLREMIARTLQEVRRLAADLRPSALDDLGLIPTVENYIDEFAKQTGLHVVFIATGLDAIRLPHDVEIMLYRVIQESLTNITRHADATAAEVKITCNEGMIQVCIQDNGRGFNPEQTLQAGERGLGLIGMRERVELISGMLEFVSSPGHGTQIQIQVPIQE